MSITDSKKSVRDQDVKRMNIILSDPIKYN